MTTAIVPCACSGTFHSFESAECLHRAGAERRLRHLGGDHADCNPAYGCRERVS